jgi:hypothetical protein
LFGGAGSTFLRAIHGIYPDVIIRAHANFRTCSVLRGVRVFA